MKRKQSIDILRILAAAAVVLFHVLGGFVSNDPMSPEGLNKIAPLFNAALQWHVPVFFMITGFLWLGSEKACTYGKMWKNIRRFLLVLFTIGFAYALMETYFATRSISLQQVGAALKAVLTGKLWDHMWFVYSIIGIYLFLPVLKAFFERSSVKTVLIFTAILFGFNLLYPVITALTGLENPIKFPGTEQVFYVCAGGVIAKMQITKKWVPKFAPVVFLLSMAGAALAQWRISEPAEVVAVFNAVSAAALFLTVAPREKAARENTWVQAVSDCTFGIYLLHPLFINIIIKVMYIYPARHLPLISLPLTAVGIMAVSFGIIYLLRKIPFVKKYIL